MIIEKTATYSYIQGANENSSSQTWPTVPDINLQILSKCLNYIESVKHVYLYKINYSKAPIRGTLHVKGTGAQD